MKIELNIEPNLNKIEVVEKNGNLTITKDILLTDFLKKLISTRKNQENTDSTSYLLPGTFFYDSNKITNKFFIQTIHYKHVYNTDFLKDHNVILEVVTDRKCQKVLKFSLLLCDGIVSKTFSRFTRVSTLQVNSFLPSGDIFADINKLIKFSYENYTKSEKTKITYKELIQN